MSFGSTLRTARTSRGMTQTDLGAAMSPPESIFKISLWECDKRQPGADQIRGLCRVLQISADALLELAPMQPGLSSAPLAALAPVTAPAPVHAPAAAPRKAAPAPARRAATVAQAATVATPAHEPEPEPEPARAPTVRPAPVSSAVESFDGVHSRVLVEDRDDPTVLGAARA